MSLYHRKIEGGPVSLLILHGVFGSSDNWLTTGKQLAANGYDVYLIDQRNHGRSPHHDKLDYPSMASDLREFVVAQNINNPVLIGHSMGGKTVMEYAIRWPAEIKKLIVVDIAPKAYPIHHARLLEGLEAIPIEKLESRQEADDVLSGYEPSLGVRQFLLKNLYKTDRGSYAWRFNLPVLKRDMALIGAPTIPDKPLTVPTLFISGEKSDYVGDSDWAEISKSFTNAELVKVPDAGHWVQAEQPALFLEAVLAFLTK